MLDKEPVIINNIPLTKTTQWSQRPHLALTEFYRKMLDTYFKPDEKSFIEDKVHGRLISDYNSRGKVGWNDWKLFIYSPQRDMKRSYHLDGRGDEKMYENI